jgi:alpha-glucuronidase
MAHAEDGYNLWLRYLPVADERRLAEYRAGLTEIVVGPGSPALEAAKKELVLGLSGLLDRPFRVATTTTTTTTATTASGTVLAGTPGGAPAIAALGLADELAKVGTDGFVVRRVSVAGKSLTVVAANSEIGVLYGAFALLRHLQTHRPLADLDIVGAPRLPLRMLDHWDNLDRTVERGYAGASIWDWQKLPQTVSPQIEDYARANASIGINAVALTNVNANARVLTEEYLAKVAALATVLRRYGIRVYLTARFSAPMQIGGLATADPLDGNVVRWWRDKCREITRHVPDFGGFLVKANSEGQPGPQDYGRTHADGANLLANALAEAGGQAMVLWRAFVYHENSAEDRAKQAFIDLTPLDGKFRENVAIQIKNGPIDFQPREPFHPLFGAMPKTPCLVEFQITQEYLGQGTHLAYLAPLYRETLDADTFANGPGSTVAKLIRGMAGVANIGTDRNWCGHPFAAANWFAYGRLAWDSRLGAAEIAEDWLRMTFTNDQRFVAPAKALMLASREAVVNYMTPLGLHHLMAKDHHHGPGPWVNAGDTGRADWSAVYYHRADSVGIGFDRSPTGSNAVAQYRSPWREIFADVSRCPEELLLWFHHVPWTHPMKSGRPLWDELCLRYQSGVDSVRAMRATWDALAAFVDRPRFEHVKMLLAIQGQEARWWHDACLLYFQTFSKRPFPPGCQRPAGRLEDYRLLKHSYVPELPVRSIPQQAR